MFAGNLTYVWRGKYFRSMVSWVKPNTSCFVLWSVIGGLHVITPNFCFFDETMINLSRPWAVLFHWLEHYFTSKVDCWFCRRSNSSKVSTVDYFKEVRIISGWFKLVCEKGVVDGFSIALSPSPFPHFIANLLSKPAWFVWDWWTSWIFPDNEIHVIVITHVIVPKLLTIYSYSTRLTLTSTIPFLRSTGRLLATVIPSNQVWSINSPHDALWIFLNYPSTRHTSNITYET